MNNFKNPIICTVLAEDIYLENYDIISLPKVSLENNGLFSILLSADGLYLGKNTNSYPVSEVDISYFLTDKISVNNKKKFCCCLKKKTIA